MKIENFVRHKATHGYLAAKYPAVLLYGLLAILLFVPYLRYLAWLLAMVIFFREKDSRFLRLHAAQAGLLTLIFSLLSLSLAFAGDIIQLLAVRSRDNDAMIQASFVTSALAGVVQGLAFAILLIFIIEALLAYTYRILYLPLVGKGAKKLCDRTDPGPLR